MMVDGRKIAERIFVSLREQAGLLGRQPILGVIACAPNFETRKFLEIKRKKAEETGIRLVVTELNASATLGECIDAITQMKGEVDGMVIQLPFPSHINRDRLIEAIQETHDVDAFSLHDSEVLPPVVGAMKEILVSEHIEIFGKEVVIVGQGMLVGSPALRWFNEQGAHTTVLTRDTKDIGTFTAKADIIVLGAGSPGLLTPDMIKDGVVILDAGTSEEGGELRGDADPMCASKASIFTPVPGGIGPITIAVLLRNVVELARRKSS